MGPHRPHRGFTLALLPGAGGGGGQVGEIPAAPVVKLGAASILLYLLVENKLGGLLEWKVGKAMAGATSYFPSHSNQGVSCSQA